MTDEDTFSLQGPVISWLTWTAMATAQMTKFKDGEQGLTGNIPRLLPV